MPTVSLWVLVQGDSPTTTTDLRLDRVAEVGRQRYQVLIADNPTGQRVTVTLAGLPFVPTAMVARRDAAAQRRRRAGPRRSRPGLAVRAPRGAGAGAADGGAGSASRNRGPVALPLVSMRDEPPESPPPPGEYAAAPI